MNEHSKELIFSDSESRHIKSLRLSETELVMVTNGKYLTSTGTILRTGKRQYAFIPQVFHHRLNEPALKLTLAIGILRNSDRFEFAIEKAVELGTSEIVPLITQHAEQNKIRTERLEQKAIAAMKQCKRSFLPKILPPIEFDQFIAGLSNYGTIILADEKGKTPKIDSINSPCCIMIGPEGGFSDAEVVKLTDFDILKWKLGDRRLRTETASIAAISQFISIL